MKAIGELDHYELLEIPHSATSGQIDRAYRLAQQTFAEGSLALYSIFENGDAAAIRARLDEAYRVLADAESREAYNLELQIPAPASESGMSDSRGDRDSALAPEVANALSRSDAYGDDEGEERTFEAFDEIDGYDALDEDQGGEYDGVRLRRARMFRGYEIEDISDVTKVSGTHLRNIEEENFRDLPADVYVRGFVTAYAKTIGLDPKVVVPGYMARVAESRSAEPRGRFLGRR